MNKIQRWAALCEAACSIAAQSDTCTSEFSKGTSHTTSTAEDDTPYDVEDLTPAHKTTRALGHRRDAAAALNAEEMRDNNAEDEDGGADHDDQEADDVGAQGRADDDQGHSINVSKVSHSSVGHQRNPEKHRQNETNLMSVRIDAAGGLPSHHVNTGGSAHRGMLLERRGYSWHSASSLSCQSNESGQSSDCGKAKIAPRLADIRVHGQGGSVAEDSVCQRKKRVNDMDQEACDTNSKKKTGSKGSAVVCGEQHPECKAGAIAGSLDTLQANCEQSRADAKGLAGHQHQSAMVVDSARAMSAGDLGFVMDEALAGAQHLAGIGAAEGAASCKIAQT